MVETSRKRTPEEYLRDCQAEEDAAARGRLKVFLGYASGVGKSERMLREARRRRERGQHLAIAALQPKTPPEVMAILDGMPVIPTRTVNGRDVIDVDALLDRRPSVCVIDGLAYDNPPGSRNAARWQDAQMLLAAGISVIGSVNIQYIAELRAEVEAITGKSVQETVPLEFLKTADEIELVDAPAERMGEDPRRLAKLREIALVAAADVVDQQLSGYLRAHGIDQTPGAQERILICVTPRSNLRAMLDTGSAIAERFHGQLIVAYVRQPEITPNDQAMLDEKLEAGRAAGAQIVELEGENPVAAILDYAKAHGVTQLFVGHSQQRGVLARIRRNPVEKFIRNSQNMDIRVFPQ